MAHTFARAGLLGLIAIGTTLVALTPSLLTVGGAVMAMENDTSPTASAPGDPSGVFTTALRAPTGSPAGVTVDAMGTPNGGSPSIGAAPPALRVLFDGDVCLVSLTHGAGAPDRALLAMTRDSTKAATQGAAYSVTHIRCGSEGASTVALEFWVGTPRTVGIVRADYPAYPMDDEHHPIGLRAQAIAADGSRYESTAKGALHVTDGAGGLRGSLDIALRAE